MRTGKRGSSSNNGNRAGLSLLLGIDRNLVTAATARLLVHGLSTLIGMDASPFF